MPAAGTYSVEAVRALDTHRTPIQKQPEMLLCLVGLSRIYYLGDEVYLTFLHDNDRDMDLFSLIRALNPTKVKVGSRLRAPHEVPFLTLTANRVIEMDDPATASESSGVPPTIKRSPLDFSLEARASDQGTAASEVPPSGEASVTLILCVLLILQSALRPMWPSVVATEYPKSKNASSLTEVGSPGGVYRPEWGVTNARQVALRSQLRLRFEQEAKLLRKSVAQVARRDKRIEARELEIKNLEALLETEAKMKKAVEDKSAVLINELEDIRARFSDLRVSHEHLSQQVASLKEQVSGEEKLKAAFEEFKQYKDEGWSDGVGRRARAAPSMMKCAEYLEMRQAFADVVSAGVAKGMSEGLKHGVEHGQAQQTVESIEAYDLEAEAKFVAALQSLKDLKYPLLDQLEGLKDAPMDVIMAALYLESDTGGDAPQYIRDLRPSSSQLTILVYPEVRDPRNPWAYKEEMKLSDAIATNISHAQKKKKMPHSMPYSRGWLRTSCQVGWRSGVCTHGGPPGSCPFAGGRGYADCVIFHIFRGTVGIQRPHGLNGIRARTWHLVLGSIQPPLHDGRKHTLIDPEEAIVSILERIQWLGVTLGSILLRPSTNGHPP
uniref:Transposase (Putative), gypsy type n=1 Tax=Tanacetum cinerariifolium TaxID=118510 RepID=A0A6L2M0N9_TANCI|nr:hypothetical protein [Tanacetum cinerariifolium]